MQAVLLRKTDVCLPFCGLPPCTPQRHAAVLSLRISISCSAHSHANAPELELVCNITEAPPVADEARRCWRKTRSITPAPRAIGDYVLRGLNGVLCTPHEPALVQAPARLRANVPSCLPRRASYVLRRGVRGVSGLSPEFAFLLQAFSFSNKKKMPKRCKR